MPLDGKRVSLYKWGSWLLSCFAVSFLFLNNVRVPTWSYFQSQGLYPWAVLMLCAFWIYLKRDELTERRQAEPEKFADLPFFLLGVGALALSLSMPRNVEIQALVFEILLACWGLFAILFGRAAILPGALLGIYGFSVAFPLAVARYLDAQYSLATVWTVVTVLKTSGFQAMSQGQSIIFTSASGREISLFINAACSGSASMSIFLAIFALMMLDIRLPARGAMYMLAFGVVGTTAQNVLRLIILVMAGYYYDYRGVWTAHSYAGYILFPVWFTVFAYVYLRYAKDYAR